MKGLVCCLLMPLAMNAQSISGEYFLQHARETASGFKLNADSTFQFFYSEGALDRYASGRWTYAGSTVYLSTAPAPDKDYRLISKTVQPGKHFVVRITEPNKVLQQYVTCTAYASGKATSIQTNADGLASFPGMKPDSIRLSFLFCPERSSSWRISGPENQYEFGFEQWLFELFFQKLPFQLSGKTLTGINPVTGKSSEFEKAE